MPTATAAPEGEGDGTAVAVDEDVDAASSPDAVLVPVSVSVQLCMLRKVSSQCSFTASQGGRILSTIRDMNKTSAGALQTTTTSTSASTFTFTSAPSRDTMTDILCRAFIVLHARIQSDELGDPDYTPCLVHLGVAGLARVVRILGHLNLLHPLRPTATLTRYRTPAEQAEELAMHEVFLPPTLKSLVKASTKSLAVFAVSHKRAGDGIDAVAAASQMEVKSKSKSKSEAEAEAEALVAREKEYDMNDYVLDLSKYEQRSVFVRLCQFYCTYCGKYDDTNANVMPPGCSFTKLCYEGELLPLGPPAEWLEGRGPGVYQTFSFPAVPREGMVSFKFNTEEKCQERVTYSEDLVAERGIFYSFLGCDATAA
jgi:hypothetical protein